MIQKSKILIVDDERLGRVTLKSLLMDKQYELSYAADGFEAIKKAIEIQPDLILLDIMMPGMDGFETCRKLRSDSITSEIPVVMVTALDDQESLITGIEAGADDFISKPYNRTELRARVKTITKLNRFRQIVNEREKISWVVQNASIGYLFLNKESMITYVNLKARLMLGIHVDECAQIEGTFLDVAKKNYKCEPETLWETWPAEPDKILGQQIPRYLVIPETPTEKETWLLVETLNIPSGLEEQILVSMTDVTKEIVANRDLLTFHSLIMHKLRTPFHGILGGLEYLKDEITALKKQDLLEFAEITYKSATRYHKSIESILMYLSASDLSKYKTGLDLSELPGLFKKVANGLKIESLNIVEHAKFSDKKIVFDKNIMELIIFNIFENSQKFQPNNKPDMQCELTAVDTGQVKIMIRDDGITLSPKQLTEIWAPYYQIDKHFTGEVKGMGLGLSLVSSLILQAGGSYRALNRDDKPGIIIELIIPIFSADQSDSEMIE